MVNDPLRIYEQDPGEALDYSVEFAAHCARLREPDTSYPLNTRVRPVRANGYQYNASTGGRSGTNEPRWPVTVGGTVQDGSVVWTCEAINAASQSRAVSSTAWVGDAGLTIGTPTLSGTKATALISAGTLGQRYLVRVTATCDDSTTPVAAFFIEFKRPARTVNA